MQGHRIRPGENIGTGYISSVAATIRSSARILYDDGTVDFLLSPGGTVASDRTTGSFVSENLALKHGWVTDAVTVVEGTPIPKRGQLYARMSIGPTRGGALCQDYIYELNPLVQGKFVDPGPGGGEGMVRSITGTDRAAGTEMSETVPTNALWRLLSLRVVLVVGTVDIVPAFIITDGTTEKWRSRLITATGSATEILLLVPGMSQAEGGTSHFEFPDGMLLPEAYTIDTIGITGDDDYAAPELLVEEWLVV